MLHSQGLSNNPYLEPNRPNSATSQSSSYPIVLMKLGAPRPRRNPHLKFVEVPGIEPATS